MIHIVGINYIISFFIGLLTSLLYYGGLWWTVRALPSARWPVVLAVGSFYLRMGVTLLIFYVVMQNDWKRLAVCLAGFILIRIIMTGRLGPEKKKIGVLRSNNS